MVEELATIESSRKNDFKYRSGEMGVDGGVLRQVADESRF